MKAAFVIHVRDKAEFIGLAVNSVLAQSQVPLEILLSDQGSTDGTLQIMQELAGKYDGPNTVRVLECPWVNYRGHVGMNEHVNWIHNQTDADVMIMMSGDDVTHPDRAKRTVRAYLDYAPDMVLTGCWQTDAQLNLTGHTIFPEEDGMVKPEHMFAHCVGGSTGISWSRAFWDKYGPLDGSIAYDYYFTFLAALDKGCYFIADKLHYYVSHASEDNTGLEGQLRATDDPIKRVQIEEQMHYQITYNLARLATKCEEAGLLQSNVNDILYQQMLGRSYSWAVAREKLTLAKVAPLAMKV